MQQHSGQHLLSAVLAELFGFQTVSFHLGAESSTIDLATPGITAKQLIEAERRVNEAVFENRPMRATYEDAAEASTLRKASERTGLLRIVSIDGMDRSACGGTHVRSTGEIGTVLLRKTEKIRSNVRLEFVCGARAVRRARSDFEALTKIAGLFSSSLEDAPELAAAQRERLEESEKSRRKLAGELAVRRGHELHAQTPPDPSGLRLHECEASEISEEVRQEAQGFTAQGKAVYLALAPRASAFLLACSADSGINAGQFVKQALSETAGRGGGNAQLAQGSMSGDAALDVLRDKLRAAIP
jgi:alanyl-tRNA synthetase